RSRAASWRAIALAALAACSTPPAPVPPPPEPAPAPAPAPAPVDVAVELAAARAARIGGDDAAAREHLERAVGADATLVDARLDLAELLLERAADLARAETLLDEARALRGPDAREERLRGAVLEARGDEQEAVAAYERALAREANPDLLLRRAVLLRTLGREDEAVRAFEELERVRPGDLTARVHLAELYERLGRASEAEAELRAVAAAAPQNPAPLRRLAAFYRRRGDVRGAKRAEADAARLAAPARALRPLPPSRH
ncbi:MAG: tetratricopeptide repeat protein, partial [Anaeromyxobacteraceae bacterium]